MKINCIEQKLTYCLIVTSSPYENQNSMTALNFAYALVKIGYILKIVFFYKEGVYNGNSYVKRNKEKFNILDKWKKLKTKTNCSLYVCSSSAEECGIFSEISAKKCEKRNVNLDKDFKLTSLMTLSKSIILCDRIMQF